MYNTVETTNTIKGIFYMDFLQSAYTSIEHVFNIVVQYCILMLEGVGVVIIVGTAIRCVVGTLQHKKENLRLVLAEGIAFALEFKLGSEVLRTLLARDFNELAITGVVIALRALLTFLIHWEIKNEEMRPELTNFIDAEPKKK